MLVCVAVYTCTHLLTHVQSRTRRTCSVARVWYHSIRYGFLFGPQRATLEYDMVRVFMCVAFASNPENTCDTPPPPPQQIYFSAYLVLAYLVSYATLFIDTLAHVPALEGRIRSGWASSPEGVR